jgi:hypothetical protein
MARAIPASEPNVPGAVGRYPRPKAVAMASETRGFRAALFVVVLGMLALGWLILLVLDLFRFRFVHYRRGYFVFFHGPVSEVVLAATFAAKRKLRR